MESEQKIDQLWNKIQPLTIPTVILLIITTGTLIQNQNIYSLQYKIKDLQNEIRQSSSSNEKLKLEERLKLKKDILVIEKDITTIQNGVYTTLVQALGGVMIGITAYIGYRNLKIGEENLKVGQKNLKVTEDKQVTERFSKSIEHLGSEEIEIRLGGIYALEQISIDSAKYHWTIIEILSAFIREKRPLNSTNPVGIDIQAALTVIGGRKVKQDSNDKVIDLRKISLVGVELQNTNFIKADFSSTNLSNANLSGANLSKANLSLTNLIGADLSNSNLNGADLKNTHLDDSPEPDEYQEDSDYIILLNYDSTAANLNGADLSTCKNLNQSQLIFVAKNENTKLPDYLNIPIA